MSGGGRIIGALSLEWNSLGVSDAAPRSLARALSANVALTHLDLRNNRIGSSGIVSLAEGLHGNTTLSRSTFDGTPLGRRAHGLERALQKNDAASAAAAGTACPRTLRASRRSRAMERARDAGAR